MADQKQLPSSSLRPRTADASLGNEIRPWSDMQTRQLTVRGDLDVVGDMTVTGLAQSSFQTLQAKTLESIEEIGPFVDAQGNPIGESVTEVSNRTNLRSNVTQVPGPTTVPTQAAVVGYVTDRINDLQVGDPTFQGEVTFTDKIVVSDETTGNTATLTGNTFSGISENANTWTHPREIDVDGLMKSQPVSVDGSQNETIQLQINWANRQGSKEANVQDPSDFMFADDPYPQTITSEKTWTQNIKFDPPNATYGIEGGWAEQWKNDLTLSLYDEVEGQVNFNGSEGAVKMRARLNDSFAVIPNVRLYVSAESGSDENPGDSMHRPVRTIKRAAEIARTYVERRKGPFPNFTITNFPPAAVNNPGKGSYADAADAFWGFDDNPRGQTKQDIIDAVDAWFENNEDTDISTLYAQTIDVPGFDTVGDICKRDAGFLIDAVANDLTYGGHKNMARAAAAYYATFKKPFASGGSKSGTDRLVIPESQRAATLAVWDRLRYEINERISGPSFEDARTVVDALFAGFTNTITDPLPIQANFPMEARGSVGGHAVLASAIGDAALRAGWVAETMAYMQEDHASTHAVIGVQMEQEIDAVLQAIAADLNAGGIVQTANALRVYFSNNVPTLAEEHVHPVALAYAALERTVLASVSGIDTSSARQALVWLLDGVRTTVQFPGTFAATPVVIFVATGNYVEKPPIYLPPDTSIVGDSLRSVILTADKTNELDRTDFFHCCSGVYMTNLRFKEIRSPGYCAAFPAALVGIQVGGDELSDPNDAQSERAFFPVVSPNGSGNANVLFSYPGYSKFHPPTVYVDEPRTSDSIVDRFILLRDGFGYTESEKNAIDGWVTDGTIKVRDVRERSNVKRDGNNEVIVDANTGLEEYFDEDDADPNWTGRYPGIPDRRAVFSIVWVETGGVYAIERIELTTDSSTGRPNHGKGYRGQAAFLDLPAPASVNGSGVEVLVQMKSDYAEMVVPAEGIDENGRITQVDIVYPGSGYTDNSAPWVSIAAPTDLQPYVVASPYVQNCSNLSGPFLSNGALVPKTLPLPFDPRNVFGDGIGVANLAGGGIRVDGACVKPRSPVPSFVTDAFTQLNQGGIGFLLVNRGYAQLVSTFGVFCSTHVKALGGSFANISNTVTDFGDEGLHARGYWPVPYATAQIVPPRVLVDDGTPRFVPIGSEPATEHPLKLGAGAYLPGATEEGLGVFVPQQGYRSEVLVNAPSTLWGSGFTEEVVVPGDSPLVVSGSTPVNAYLRAEISRPDVLDVGSSTARFVADRYEVQVDGTWKLLEIDETTGVWTVEGDTNVDRTSRVRAFFELNEVNVREGEVLPWSLGLDYTQGDIRVDYSTGELTDAKYEGQVTRFTGSGYKRSPTVSVAIVDAGFNDITGDVSVDVFPNVALQVSRVTPVVVQLGAELVARLIRPKFMSVCRINGTWHTIRSINRVRGEDVLSSSFAPGEYALTLFPAANWVNEGEIEFFDASYVSTNSHSMEYVGSGVTYNALPEYGGVPDRAKEIVQFSPGRVFFTSQDQLGNTRIGSQFEVDQLSGQVTINTDQFNLAGLNALGPFRTEEGATVGVQLREVSDDPNLTSASGTPGNTVPTQSAILQYFQRFVIPEPPGEGLYLQSQDINGSIRFVWETLRAADLVDDFGKIPMNVFPEQLTIDQSITTGDLTATGSTTISGDASVSGMFTASNQVVLGSNQHATTVVGDLDVSGGTVIGPVDINSSDQPQETTLYGDATVSGKVTSETLEVDGVVELGTSTDTTTVRGKLKVDGDTEMVDELVCKQDVDLEQDTFVNRVRWRGSANRPTVIDNDGRVPWARLKNYPSVVLSGDVTGTTQIGTSGDVNIHTTIVGSLFDPSGTYPSLRAQATTKGDVGLGRVPNIDITKGATIEGNLWFSGGTRYTGTISNNHFYIRTSNQDRIRILNTGQVGIGRTPDTSFRLDVSGQIRATNDITAFSDGRYNTEVNTIKNALEKVDGMHGVTYRMKEDGSKLHVGLIAQDVEKVVPEAVITDDSSEGRKSVAYGNLVGVLVEAVKELKRESDDLRKELRDIRLRLDATETQQQ